MPPSKRLRCDDPKWAQHKDAIKEMYMLDRLSQKKIREKLSENGFEVTKSELEAQLRLWNIRKNASVDAWRYIDHRLLQREQQDKASVVYYNGRKVSRDRLKKARSRSQPDTWTKCMTTASPTTPEGMELWILTPPPAPLQSKWAQTLPWLQFQDKIFPSTLSLARKAIGNQPEQSDSQMQLGLPYLHRQLNIISSGSLSAFVANLTSVMPERAEHEIADCAQLIFQGTASQAFNEQIKLILYRLSNNMIKIENDMDEEGECSWEMVLNVIDGSGMTKQPLDLRQNIDMTVASIAENLFRLCICFRTRRSAWNDGQRSNSKIISWLLDSGRDPNKAVHDDSDGSVTHPLLAATRSYDFDLATKLLDAGADPKAGICAIPQFSPLFRLLEGEEEVRRMTLEQHEAFLRLIRRLLEAGVSLGEEPPFSEPSALMLAVTVDLQVADILVQHGANIRHHCKRRRLFHFEFTDQISVLGYAVQDGNQEAAIERIHYLLGHIQQSDLSIPVADLITPDVLCIAASQGYNSVIEFCFNVDDTSVMKKDHLFPALCAASCNGHLQTCELLLEYGAPVNNAECTEAMASPLHFAALSDHWAITELLCKHGADVNASFKFDHRDKTSHGWKWALERSVYRRWSDTTGMIKECCAHCTHINPLGAAIIGAGRQEPSSISILTLYGARLPDWAVYHGAFEILPWIIRSAVEQGANLNWRGPDHRTGLQNALKTLFTTKPRFNRSQDDDLEFINALVNAGADTAGSEAELIVLVEHWSRSPPGELLLRDFYDHFGRAARNLSVLAAIFLTRSIPRIQQALETNPGAYDPGALCASVMLAISSGSTNPLRELLSNRPETVDDSHQEGVALGLAAWHGKIDMLNMLLSRIQSSTPAFIPVHLDPYSPTKNIAPTPRREELQAFISESFEERIPIWYRETLPTTQLLCGSPLTLSIWSPECLDKLLENNFYPDRLTMSAAVYHGDIKVVQRLLQTQRVDSSHADQPGPLCLSVSRRFEEITRVLLQAGYSPNEPYDLVRFGRSPLQKAVEDGNLEMIDLLLEAKADVNAPAAKTGGATALQLAAITGRLGIAKRLIDLGANVNASGAKTEGRTALEGAAEHGRLDMVQLLLHYGANTLEDGRLQWFKAIRYAGRYERTAVTNALRNHREWTNLDHEMWECFHALDGDWEELDHLEKAIPSSASTNQSSSFSCRGGNGPRDMVRADECSAYGRNSSQQESFEEGRINPDEVSCVDGGCGRHQDSEAAMSTGPEHGNMILKDHLSSDVHDDITWNQQFGAAEEVFQTLWETRQIEAVHGVHAIQGFSVPDLSTQVEWNRQPASASQGLQAAWESMQIGDEVRMEEPVFPSMNVASAWNQQFGVSDLVSNQNGLDTETASGICFEIFDEEMD